MNVLGRTLVSCAFLFGMPGTGLAQTVPSDHREHAQAPAAAPPDSAQSQSQDHRQARGHREDCRCHCCMKGHRGSDRPPAAPGADEHQQHQGGRPN